MITGDDVHHISTVMRANVGDQLILCTDDARSFLANITHLAKAEVHVEVVTTKKEAVELPVFVTIAQAITKGDKFDLIVQKGTECGASAFVPIAMKRSVAKIEPTKAGKKVQRWQKIALEAARQSHRQMVPEVGMPVDVAQLLRLAAAYDVCLFAYEEEGRDRSRALADAVAKMQAGARVLVLIGPEGGIDEVEASALLEAGFTAVGLGPRILRTETASIYVMSAISYALEIEGR